MLHSQKFTENVINHATQTLSAAALLLEHVDQGTEPGQHVIIQHVRGHLAFSDGQFAQAIEALEDAEHVGRNAETTLSSPPQPALRLRHGAGWQRGQIALARRSLDSLNKKAVTNPLNREQNSISYARLLVAEGRTGTGARHS